MGEHGQDQAWRDVSARLRRRVEAARAQLEAHDLWDTAVDATAPSGPVREAVATIRVALLTRPELVTEVRALLTDLVREVEGGAELSVSQIVAANLRRARRLRGLTQDEAAERLAPYLGTRWSKASFSAAERSVDSARDRRRFSADDLVAFARAFDLPVIYFLLPPVDPLPPAGVITHPDSPAPPLRPHQLVDLLFASSDHDDTDQLAARLAELVARLPDDWQPRSVPPPATEQHQHVLARALAITERVADLAPRLRQLLDEAEDTTRDSEQNPS